MPVPMSSRLAGRSRANSSRKRRLDHGRIDREVALAVPGIGAAVEEALGLPPPRLAHRLQPPLVQPHGGVVVGQQAAERAGEPGALAALGAAVEHPAALAEAVEQAGLGQDLQVAGDARLALAQDLDELADGPLALRADREQAQARRVRGGADAVQQLVEGARLSEHASRLGYDLDGYVDIFICRCQPDTPWPWQPGLACQRWRHHLRAPVLWMRPAHGLLVAKG